MVCNGNILTHVKKNLVLPISSGQKITVFISSNIDGKHDKPKYNPVRMEVKSILEKTEIAQVCLFEDLPGSTLPVGLEYCWQLKDCDLCIFLIDNKDGIKPEVQKQIEIVRRNNIQAIYLFCDENCKSETEIELGLKGVPYANTNTVHKFADLSKFAVRAFMYDVINTYHNCCKGNLYYKLDDETEEMFSKVNAVQPKSNDIPFMPKLVIKSIDKCKLYLLRTIFGNDYNYNTKDSLETSDIDGWGLEFLPVLFEAKSVKSFNTSLFLDNIKEY